MKNYFLKKRVTRDSFSDQEVLDVLVGSLVEEDDVLKFLYATVKRSLFPFVRSNQGTLDDANDILQDAIIVFYEKVKSREFRLQTTISGYIYTVGKYMWLNRLKILSKETSFSDKEIDNMEAVSVNVDMCENNLSTYTEMLLEKMRKGCKQILIDSIYKKMSMKEIATAYGLKSDQIARNKKHKCLKNLRTMIENSPYYLSILNEIKL